MVTELVVTGTRDGVTVVTVSGDVDMASVPRLRSELVQLIASLDDPPRVVLDLCGVDLLDTIGLAVILEAVKRCSSRGGSVALARAEPQVRRELESTGVIGILPVHDDVGAAERALSGSRP